MQLMLILAFLVQLTVSFNSQVLQHSKIYAYWLCFLLLSPVPMMNHHTMPKFGYGPYKTANGVGTFYLPKILNNNRGYHSKVSLEFSHANSKKYATSIPLPSDKLDSNKRYLVTFTLKDNENQNVNGDPDQKAIESGDSK
jgi:hypothetical protein